MAFNKNKVATTDAPGAVAVQEAPKPAETLAKLGENAAADYPATPPLEARSTDDLRALHSNSDKDLRMMFAGIYQAVLQSQALYAARNVMDVATWHNAVEEEVEYFVRRVLERSQKE